MDLHSIELLYDSNLLFLSFISNRRMPQRRRNGWIDRSIPSYGVHREITSVDVAGKALQRGKWTDKGERIPDRDRSTRNSAKHLPDTRKIPKLGHQSVGLTPKSTILCSYVQLETLTMLLPLHVVCAPVPEYATPEYVWSNSSHLTLQVDPTSSLRKTHIQNNHTSVNYLGTKHDQKRVRKIHQQCSKISPFSAPFPDPLAKRKKRNLLPKTIGKKAFSEVIFRQRMVGFKSARLHCLLPVYGDIGWPQQYRSG